MVVHCLYRPCTVVYKLTSRVSNYKRKRRVYSAGANRRGGGNKRPGVANFHNLPKKGGLEINGGGEDS